MKVLAKVWLGKTSFREIVSIIDAQKKILIYIYIYNRIKFIAKKKKIKYFLTHLLIQKSKKTTTHCIFLCVFILL